MRVMGAYNNDWKREWKLLLFHEGYIGIMENKMETTEGLYGDSGKQNGNY